MRNGKVRNSCLYGEEVVAYIYGELNPADRSSFEMHLLDCSGCAAEFADISFSRLGVYEWHRDEFLPLATPQFKIPYKVPSSLQPGYSWLDGLRNFVSPVRVAFASGSLAAIILGTIVFVSWDTNDDTVATTLVPAQQVDETLAAELPVSVAAPTIVETKGNQEPAKAPRYRSVRPAPELRIVEAKARSIKKQQNVPTTSASSSPRLGTFVEPEDNSLRLVDLVADIDTRDIE